MTFRHSTRASRHGDNPSLIWFLGIVVVLVPPIEELCLQDSRGWTLQEGNKEKKCWNLTNKTWRCLKVIPRSNFVKLNYRWDVQFSVGVWISFWKKYWGPSLSIVIRSLSGGF